MKIVFSQNLTTDYVDVTICTSLSQLYIQHSIPCLNSYSVFEDKDGFYGYDKQIFRFSFI